MQDDPYFKAAAGCFGLARNYLRKPTLRDISLDVREYYQAVCEIVVFLLHLSDRLIFEAAPNSRNVRMDALVVAAIRVFAEEIRADPNIPNAVDLLDRLPTLPPELSLPPEYGANNTVVTRAQYDAARARLWEPLETEVQRRIEIEKSNDAAAVATQIFRDLYDDRTEEYAGVDTDWFRLILLKFGRHFSEAVNGGELSMEIFMDVQAEAVRMQVALLDCAPELFKP